MSLLTQPVGLTHYLVVSAILFVCGIMCMATKRNVLGVLMGIELVLNGEPQLHRLRHARGSGRPARRALGWTAR